MLESAARVRRMKARGTVEPVDRFRAPVADTIDARRVVDSVARLGVDFIEVRTAASPETYQAIASATRRAGLTLAAHGDIVPPEDMLRSRQRSIEHAIYPPLQKRDAAIRVQLIRELASAQVAIVPTMVNYSNGCSCLRPRRGGYSMTVSDGSMLGDATSRGICSRTGGSRWTSGAP